MLRLADTPPGLFMTALRLPGTDCGNGKRISRISDQESLCGRRAGRAQPVEQPCHHRCKHDYQKTYPYFLFSIPHDFSTLPFVFCLVLLLHLIHFISVSNMWSPAEIILGMVIFRKITDVSYEAKYPDAYIGVLDRRGRSMFHFGRCSRE